MEELVAVGPTSNSRPSQNLCCKPKTLLLPLLGRIPDPSSSEFIDCLLRKGSEHFGAVAILEEAAGSAGAVLEADWGLGSDPEAAGSVGAVLECLLEC